MTLEVLDSIRNKNPYLYSCQYANNPRNPDLQDFNIAAVKRYRFSQRGDSVVIEDGNETTVIPLKSLDVVITCDPSIGEKVKDDPVAIMVCGVDPEGRVFVLDVFNKRCTPIEMIEKFFVMYFRWNCRILGIEGVAYQKAIKYFVAQEMEARQKWMNVQELKVDTTKSKETRIRGLQPLVATGRLYVRAEQQELLDQLDEFPLGEHDDILDTLQMQQQLWRGVVSKKRMEEYEALEKEIIAGLKHTSATGYGPSDRSLFHSSDFDLDGDDDLEVRSAWEHQGSTMVEVV
jgi:predicted phage terminase large subunit-like protein